MGKDQRNRPSTGDALALFSPPVRQWFARSFGSPTAAQAGAWASIAAGGHTLVVAPTGSGKTLAAFLSAIDRLVIPRDTSPDDALDPRLQVPADASAAPARRCRVLYISPLKALAVDVERNLRTPLEEIAAVATASGEQVRRVDIAVRSGDTSPSERAAFARRGADILITTPESLFLLLTSKARERLRDIDTVIIDEIHAVTASKRGAHLAVSLDRLDALLDRPAQRIGLSATARPTQEVARFLAGGRPVAVVAPPVRKQVEIDVIVPVGDMSDIGAPSAGLTSNASKAPSPARTSIWPHVEERIVDLVEQHRSTIVFANSRRLAERLTARLNEIHADRRGTLHVDEGNSARPAQIMAQSGTGRGAESVLARAHHGSVSRQQRSEIEDALKHGELPAVVATSSLELGIDMGAVDLVIQVESPPSVASGLQRIGRAGHHVGAPSKGVLFPKFRGDLVSAAVATERMRVGLIEHLRVIANPLDIAAQQIVAICAMETVTVGDVLALLRRSAPFANLTRDALASVLDMLSGRYPSERFADLKPRITWDRDTDRLIARPSAQRLAVTAGGTIPDRGLFGVFLVGGEQENIGVSGTARASGGRRVGELDEEMVYESRVGDVFVLGSSSWRIVDIGRDRVEVVPAPGSPGRLPFWKADTAGRPAELGHAHGSFVRELARSPIAVARGRLETIGLDEFAVDNLLSYLAEQREATGTLPDDRTLVIERFRDELGDWRVVVHSPFGAAVHAPWALVIAARMRDRFGVDVRAQHSDDGIVLRVPDIDDAGLEGALSGLVEAVVLDPGAVRGDVLEQLGGSAVFAARFRECAARALLLPRQRIGQRQPLWQQRHRAAQLLEVAADYPEFPIVAEAARECLADVFDVPALIDLMRRIAERDVTIVEVTTTVPSPFARSLLFGYVAHFIYDGDTPLAERRAAALTVDPTLLADLLGGSDAPPLRELLDADAMAAVAESLQRLSPERHARNDDEIADLVRILGPLTVDEIEARTEPGVVVPTAVSRLAAARRVIEVRIADRQYWTDPSDAGLLRDALGVAVPPGLADVFLEPVADPLGQLFRRFARTHTPFTAGAIGTRFGLGVAVVRDVLGRLVDEGRLVRGDLLPGRPGVDDRAKYGDRAEYDDRVEYVDADVLRLLRRRSLAALRAEIEPVPPSALARFLPAWNGISVDLTEAGRPLDRLFRAVEQLAGAIVPASALETLILPARVPGYESALLDEAMTTGEITWSAHGSIGGGDAWVALHVTESVALTVRPVAEQLGPVAEVIVAILRRGGAYFFPALLEAVRATAAVRTGHSVTATTDAPAVPAAQDVLDALWSLVLAGRVTGDTFAPLRAKLADGRGVHRARPAAPRARLRSPSRLALLAGSRTAAGASGGASHLAVPSHAAGRWSLLPEADPDPTVRAAATAEVLLDRYGVVTRGSVLAEDVPGGFAGIYRVLAAMEASGRIRRGYFVEGLGAAQFAGSGAVDSLRALAPKPGDPLRPLDSGPSPWETRASRLPTVDSYVLAAADPANPYGAALPWPSPLGAATQGREAVGHRPSRRAGALVCLVGGVPVLYAERGGRTMLTFTADSELLGAASSSLAKLIDSGLLASPTVVTIDGASIHGLDSAAKSALLSVGFMVTPRGLRRRAGAMIR